MDLDLICKNLRKGAQTLALHNAAKKNHALRCVVQSIKDNKQKILDANACDVESARKGGMTESLVERLALDEKKFSSIISKHLKKNLKTIANHFVRILKKFLNTTLLVLLIQLFCMA